MVKTLLLTRPEAQSRALAQEIVEKFPHTQCLVSPLLEIAFSGILPELDSFRGVVFTSANAVRAFLAAGGSAVLPCYCVGARTAAIAKAAGFQVQSADGDISDLVALIRNTAHGALLYVRGEHVAGNLASQIDVTEAVLYRQKALPLTQEAERALADGQVDAVALYSPRTASIFASELAAHPEWHCGDITPLCMSANIAGRLEGSHLADAKIARFPERIAMLDLIAAFLG